MDFTTGDTVIVGLDGSYESAVTAYLLKKQGFNCVGVSVIFHDEDIAEFPDLFSAWLPLKLEETKKICATLEIPFYATNASDLYQQEVVDNIVAARLSGHNYDPNVDRAYVIISTLISKMKELGAKFVATGHQAKILKNQTTGTLNIHSANDLEEDDSYTISRLPYDYLSKLIFPLSEIKKSEIEKISKLIPINFELDITARREARQKLMYEEKLSEFVEKYSSKSLRKEGSVFNFYDVSTVGDHLGIHNFFNGQSNMTLKNGVIPDKELQVLRIIPSTGTIYVSRGDVLKTEIIYLIDFTTDSNLNRSLPLNCYAMLESRGELRDCVITFKNNGTILLRLNEPIDRQCYRGDYVVLYNKKGLGRRIIGGGKIRISGFYDEDEFRTIPKNKEEEDEMEDVTVQKKKDLGF